jgi:hypothetical protein
MIETRRIELHRLHGPTIPESVRLTPFEEAAQRYPRYWDVSDACGLHLSVRENCCALKQILEYMLLKEASPGTQLIRDCTNMDVAKRPFMDDRSCMGPDPNPRALRLPCPWRTLRRWSRSGNACNMLNLDVFFSTHADWSQERARTDPQGQLMRRG